MHMQILKMSVLVPPRNHQALLEEAEIPLKRNKEGTRSEIYMHNLAARRMLSRVWIINKEILRQSSVHVSSDRVHTSSDIESLRLALRGLYAALVQVCEP